MPQQVQSRETEHRHMSVGTMIFRERLRGTEVGLIYDPETKAMERAAGPWRENPPHPEYAWSVPGGGRARVGGRKETIDEAADREMREELFVEPWQQWLVFQALTNGDIQQSAPFFAAQSNGGGRMNLIAGTSLAVPFDNFDPTLQQYMEKLAHRGKFYFAQLRDLSNTYCTLIQGHDQEVLRDFRPHIFPIAFYWYMKKLGEVEKAIDIIDQQSRLAHNSSVALAQQRGMVISNGAFAENGDLLPTQTFTPEDRDFLNLK